MPHQPRRVPARRRFPAHDFVEQQRPLLLQLWLRAIDIGPKLIARDTGYALNLQHPHCRRPLPFQNSLMRDLQLTREGSTLAASQIPIATTRRHLIRGFRPRDCTRWPDGRETAVRTPGRDRGAMKTWPRSMRRTRQLGLARRDVRSDFWRDPRPFPSSMRAHE
jgi:hypothetical protein